MGPPQGLEINVSYQSQALRVLADELDAGKRELSPSMAKALARELAGDEAAAEDDDELSPEEWERAWGEEISRRLADARRNRATARHRRVFGPAHS